MKYCPISFTCTQMLVCLERAYLSQLVAVILVWMVTQLELKLGPLISLTIDRMWSPIKKLKHLVNFSNAYLMIDITNVDVLTKHKIVGHWLIQIWPLHSFFFNGKRVQHEEDFPRDHQS